MADVYFVTPLCHINLYYPAHTNKHRLIFHYVFNHELVRKRQTLSVFLIHTKVTYVLQVQKSWGNNLKVILPSMSVYKKINPNNIGKDNASLLVSIKIWISSNFTHTDSWQSRNFLTFGFFDFCFIKKCIDHDFWLFFFIFFS